MAQQGDLIHKATGKLHRRGQVRFASIEFGANEALARSQGVETLPTTRFYVDGKLVNEVTGGTKNLPQVQDKVSYYVQKQMRQKNKNP